MKRYKKVRYDVHIMRQFAYLVVNPITVYSYRFLINCTTVSQASDSMMGLTQSFKSRVGDTILTCLTLPVGFLLLRYSVLFTVESYLCFISLLYLDLYVLGDDALIS